MTGMVALLPPDGDDAVELTCPRCAASVTERFYGPCHDCRLALRAAIAGEARDIEPAAYVPKMNVTPNAVAGSS